MSSYGAFQFAKHRIGQVQLPKDENSEKSFHQNQKRTAQLKSLGNSTQNQKQMHLIWSLDD